MIGKRFSDVLTMAGRIYYETHIAPLLRIQGTFEEFAIDVLRADGRPLQMIANAAERRDAEGKPLAIRLALIRATDRRRYEKELLGARELAKVAESVAEENSGASMKVLSCANNSSQCLVTISATPSPRSAQARAFSTVRYKPTKSIR